MSAFTRVTIIGSSKKATLVLPSDEPVGIHLSDIGALLGEPHSVAETGPLTLVTPVGEELDLDASLADQTVLDGNVLRLVRVSDVPPPPEVTDVTDAVADVRDSIRHGWSTSHRVLAGSTTAALLVGVIATAIQPTAPWFAALIYSLLVASAAALGVLRRSEASTLVTGGAIGAAFPVTLGIVEALPGDTSAVVVTLALFSVLVWVALGFGWGFGRQSKAAALGAGTGIVFGGLVVGLTLAGVDVTHTAATIGIVATGILGVLPTVALTLSGTTALDDRVISGLLPDRTAVEDTVAHAYRTFAWTVYALALWLGASGLWLLLQRDIWAVLLGTGVVIVTLLRTRVMPSALHSWPLWAVGILAGIAGIALSAIMPGWLQLTALGVGVIAVAVATLARPSAHGRIRLRRLGDQFETLAAISLIPCLIGVFGAYSFMLGAFS